jgi:hypothetical protein
MASLPPEAEIKWGFGFNVGSGWVGDHYGAADALRLADGGSDPFDITFNFEPLVEVAIDVRPNNDHNQVNTNARQLVPVAVLGTEAFDPCTEVDIDSVSAREAPALTTKFDCEDVDGDGIDDLVLYFRARQMQKPTEDECADPDATLTVMGSTLGGAMFAGSDQVTWIGPDCD